MKQPRPEFERPLLIPRPRLLEFRGGRGVSVSPDLGAVVDRLLRKSLQQRDLWQPHRDIEVMVDPTFSGGSHSYHLWVGREVREDAPVRIAAVDSVGLRQALTTLRQLITQYGHALPSLHIADSPAFATRGVMLDVSRCKVPTTEQLKQTLDLLASLKFNHVQLYTEHTFAYNGHEEVWADASPITPDEVRELDAYAASRGIEFAANQNCFGHLASWLKRPRYQPLAEIEGDGVWKFMQWERRGPFSLCPIEPGSEALVRDLLGQLLPHFRSPLVNIGCDETFDVGWGRSQAEVARRAAERFAGNEDQARASLFFDFVVKIAAIAHAHNKRPMMWADIALHHPDMLARLPKDMIGLAWGYEPDARFREECGYLSRHDLAAWVCPGTSTWRSITGRTTESRGNMLAAAACSDVASGFLICDWGDVGHMQQWPLTMLRLADAAEAAWNGPAARFDAAHDQATSLHVFSDSTRAIAGWLNQLGDLDLSLRTRCKVRNATAIFNDLFPPIPPKPGHRYLTDAPLPEWEAVRAQFAGLRELRPPVRDKLLTDELDHTLAMTDLAIEHGLSCRLTSDGLRPRAEDVAGLRVAASDALSGLERLWTVRNRPGGLKAAGDHLRRVIDGLASA